MILVQEKDLEPELFFMLTSFVFENPNLKGSDGAIKVDHVLKIAHLATNTYITIDQARDDVFKNQVEISDSFMERNSLEDDFSDVQELGD